MFLAAIFFGLVIYGISQLAMAINQAIISGDKIWQDPQRLKSLLMIVGIPLVLAFALLMIFKRKIKFK
jgi:hypothetical protein